MLKPMLRQVTCPLAILIISIPQVIVLQSMFWVKSKEATVTLATPAALKGESQNDAISEELNALFGYPANEPLPQVLARLPADRAWVRNLLMLREESRLAFAPEEDKPIEQKRLAVEMGVSSDDLEPHVAWASLILTIKGYSPNNSGFNLWYDTDGPDLNNPVISWHSIDRWIRIPTAEEIKIIESVPGAKYDVFRNGIFINATGKTLAEVKAIFDEAARRLPDHGEFIRDRFVRFEKVLTGNNIHFIMKRELRNQEEYFLKREYYLSDFVHYSREQTRTDITDIVSLAQEIVDEEYENGSVDEEFVKNQFRDAILSGKVMILDKDDIKDVSPDGIDITKMVQQILRQQGSRVMFNGVELRVHPGFRLAFLLNEAETVELIKRVKRKFPQFDFPQVGLDVATEVMHRLLNTEYWQALSQGSQDEIGAIRSVPFNDDLRDVVNQFHRGYLSEEELVASLTLAFEDVLKSDEGIIALHSVLKAKFPNVVKSSEVSFPDLSL